ncbi:DNA primase [Candidatus Saccharibacteria bacterium]|nr:DNA primase [Candidatus Saccharibacteria bacterium]
MLLKLYAEPFTLYAIYMDAVSEVKSRLNIEDVISEYVQLKRAGRNFKGLSPWTNEKTPSFIVSPEKQIWHDFSSSRGGDMFSFVMEMEGLDFRGALEHLARKAGIDLEQFQSSTAGANSKFKARVSEALSLAAKFYQKQLTVNYAALSYLLSVRKFSKKTLLDWQLGYSPNTSRGLTDFLSKKGFEASELKAAGLITQRRDGSNADMFRGRIMIPLCDSRGNVIGFTARFLETSLSPAGEAPKYINTPSTPLYDKSRHVFGLHLAKETTRKAGFVVVVEGNMDVIASHQAGVTNVVATAGTAMTTQHLRELKRFTGDIRLCFDSDQAGITATERVIPLAQKVGVNLNIVSIDSKDGKDADELVQKDPQLWQKAIKQAKYAPDWLIEHYKDSLDLSSAQGKRAFTDALLVTIRRLSDPVEKEHYLKTIAEATNTSLEAIKSKLSASVSDDSFVPRRKVAPQSQILDQSAVEYQRLQDHFLANVLMQPKLRDLLDNLKPEYFSEGPARTTFKFLEKYPDFKGLKKAASPANPSKADQESKELQEIADYVKIISLQFEELYQDLSLEDLRIQAASLKKRLIERYVKSQKRQISVAMQTEVDEKKLQGLIQKVDQLNKLINPPKK